LTPDKPEEPIGRQTRTENPRDRFSLVSHDLRSALSDILGGLKLIDPARLDDETRAHLDRIAVSGETLARLLDKTLTEDPDQAEAAVTRAVNLNLAGFLSDIHKRWSDRAREDGVEFTLESPASLPAIVTLDRVSLDRIIANLIGNSIKFADGGKVKLHVTCDAEKALRLRVTDDGPGFSQAALARLFEFQGRPPDTEKPGTGLGLFIAKELADVLGATLEITNRPDDGGACAELCLPHSAWFDRSLRREARARDVSGTGTVDLSGLKILLAEDNKTNQLVATQMLGAMGAEFRVASDGLEGLELLETETFDLALLDIEMPRMSGLELIKAARRMPRHVADMPLVALTAYVMREHRERIYAAGADGIIAKPLMSIEELGLAILDYHNGAKARAGRESDREKSNVLQLNQAVDRKVFDTLIQTIGADSTAELLGKLQADTDTVAEGIVRGRKSLDLAEIRSQTHILISVAGAIGATRLQHIAQRLNTAANRQEAAEIDELCENCLSGLAELQGFILKEQAKADLHP